MEDADGETLDKLADAVGRPTTEALESAKALFPFIAHEAVMSRDAPVAPESGRAESAGRHPAAPGGRRS